MHLFLRQTDRQTNREAAVALPECIAVLAGAGPFHQARHHPGSFVAASKYGPLPRSQVAAKIPGIQGRSW